MLHLVDLDKKPSMGFIDEEMEWVKNMIQSDFNGVKKSNSTFYWLNLIVFVW